MSDFLDKLNLLLRSNLGNLLGGTERRPTSLAKLTPESLGKDVDREIAALRKQIADALDKEDAMKARLEGLRDQIVDLDAKADRALEAGNETLARQTVQAMQATRRKAKSLEAELERHRTATFDLIQHVNTLESLVSDARRAQAESGAAPPPQAEAPEAHDQQDSLRTAGAALSDMLRTVRERVEEAVSPRPPASDEEAEAPPAAPADVAAPPPRPAPADPEVEEDLARRRSRLSRPD
jgi:phage shock protein A